jgi:acyl-CoA synthetase (AMP-forming)/AMP-acid ligase II
MMPVYGLAENVVASCFPALGSEPRVDTVDREALEQTQFASPSRPERGRSRRVTSVGRPLVGQRLRIVDGADAPVAERVVGAVQISGACVMKEYRKRPMESVSVFTKDGWLRTGDLGYLAGGDLFIVGREKDIIKKNGAKYDAADIQGVVSAVHGARAGGAAVFSVDDPECGTEAIVAVVETRLSRTDDLDALKAAVAREVRQVFGTSLDRVVLVPVGSLAKSTSGKVRNAACRDAFLRGTVRELQVLGASE